jgi:hypothetical protein
MRQVYPRWRVVTANLTSEDAACFAVFARRADPIRRGLDAFVAEVDFRLASMVGYVDVHSEQDFTSEQAPIR